MTTSPITDIIIPALNEENAVGKVIHDLPTKKIRHIIVVDNGSTDNTRQKAEEAGAIVLVENRKGYGSACLKAMHFIAEQSTSPDIVAFIDADYSDYPEQLSELLKPIQENKADMVIGSRALGETEKGALTIPQRFGNALACRLIKWLHGYHYTDLGPFRAISYPALKSLKMRDPDYGWTVEMQIKAAKKKLNCIEMPVNYRKRIGISKVSGTVKGVVMAGYKIIALIFIYTFVPWE